MLALGDVSSAKQTKIGTTNRLFKAKGQTVTIGLEIDE